jgi:hypothetical protein
MSDASKPFLRRALLADAVISGVSAAFMLLGAAPLSRLLGVPADLLRAAGLSLIPFTAFVAWIAMRAGIARAAVRTVIALNAAWVIASVALLFVDAIDPTRLGIAFILIQAAAVALFAEVQWMGLTRDSA